MTQNEKVTVKLTLEMDVKSALTNFDDCKTAEDIVDCMVLELNDQFACTGSGITITDADVIKKPEHPHDEMSNEEAINQLNFMMEIMPKEPPEECDDIDEWMDTDKDIRTTFKMAIEALKQKSCLRLADLPSITPAHKKGNWIFTQTKLDRFGYTVECPSCHKKWKTYDELRWKKENKFCPNCGKEIEGDV